MYVVQEWIALMFPFFARIVSICKRKARKIGSRKWAHRNLFQAPSSSDPHPPRPLRFQSLRKDHGIDKPLVVKKGAEMRIGGDAGAGFGAVRASRPAMQM